MRPVGRKRRRGRAAVGWRRPRWPRWPRYDGMIHGFYWMLGALETAQVLHDDIAEAAVPVLTPVAAV